MPGLNAERINSACSYAAFSKHESGRPFRSTFGGSGGVEEPREPPESSSIPRTPGLMSREQGVGVVGKGLGMGGRICFWAEMQRKGSREPQRDL